jgi:cytochrome c-type biogenesis protein
MMENVTIWIALWAGFASFISPCCLPLYPSYISYITGISVSQLKEGGQARDVRLRTMTHTFFFIVGFSAVFFTLGSVAGIIAEIFREHRDLISRLAGILFVLMGLMLMGIFQPQFLMKERKLSIKFRKAGYLGSLLLGIGFAAGWSPCVGPILSAILALSATEPGAWLPLITAYTVGFAIPFFILAFFIGTTKWIVRYSGIIMKIGGAVMILIGILLYTEQLIIITSWINSITPSWLTF